MVAVLVALHLLAGVVVLVGGRRAHGWTLAVAAAPMLVAAVALATRAPEVLGRAGRIGAEGIGAEPIGAEPTERWRWIDTLGVSVSFRLDGYALLMAFAVSAVGALVIAYSAGYFRGHPDTARTCRFAAFMTMFAGAMLGLVTAGDVWTLFAFWELTSVLSFLLIGLDDGAYTTRFAAQRALLVTAAGGLAMLGGLLCLVHVTGSSDLEAVLAGADDSTMSQVGAVLVLVGAFTKSAQVPFHFWLPGAMAAPTPVSAYLHSATMVKAGVVLVARMAPAFAVLDWWRPALVCVGGATMLLGGVAALRRDDAKQALAFGTVSQLGFLTLLAGFGDHAVTAAGVAMLAAHVVFKCGLFLAVGAVDHATGTRSLTRNAGVGRALPGLAAAAGLCTLSMVGFPLLLGFAAKESAFAALDQAGGGWAGVALVTAIAGSMLTVAYSIRLWWGLFGRSTRGDAASADPALADPAPSDRAPSDVARSDPAPADPAPAGLATVHHQPGWLLWSPVAVFGLASLLGGVLASPLGRRLAVAAEALDQRAHGHLAVWPGFHAPLLYSAIAVAGGLLVAAVVILRPDKAAFAGSTLGERWFSRSYTGLLNGAGMVTMVTLSGSLPVYVAVVFSVLAGVTGVGLAYGADTPWGDTVLADGVLQAVVAVLAIVMALAVVAARRRFVSVLLLGGVGQALTVLFLMYGAPDLALTQFMIESLSIVAFLLVLRHLPREYAPAPSWAPKTLRVAISVAVGVAVAWFALAAGTPERPGDVTEFVEANSLEQAGGRNVVNVTIVDFRGVDTMFEITVFGTAALGVANLVAASRGVRRPDPRRMARIGAESLVFQQTTKMVFHLTLLVSVYVLLRGHNAPGGGFAGGLIAGAAFVFRLLAGDSASDRRSRIDIPPIVLIATGILLAVGSGIGGLANGGEFLETEVWHFHVPLIGDVHFPTAGIFDIGVYALVIGVVILVLGNLASRVEGARA